MSDRDCENCKHHTEKGCDSWDCKFEPCEDAISRQAVLDIIKFEYDWLLDAKGHNADTKIAFSGMKSSVLALPPVNPQEPKTGHWVRDTITDLYHCSKCRSICHQDPKSKDDYCRYCGAKMEESEETE